MQLDQAGGIRIPFLGEQAPQPAALRMELSELIMERK